MNATNIATPWLNTKQAAAYLGVCARTLEDMRAERKGPPARRISAKLVRYYREDLDRWLLGTRH